MNRTTVSNDYSKIILIILLLIQSVGLRAQISIDSVYTWAENNYPLIKRTQLIQQTAQYSLSNLSKGYYPQIVTTAQATYQSEIIQLPIPNVAIDPLSKDQYRLITDISQTVYDGGNIKAQKELLQSQTDIENATLKKDLFLLRERINQLFFGIILLQKQKTQISILKEQLISTKKIVDSTVQNGAAFKSDADLLQSEILLQQQREYEADGNIAAYLQMLSAFTGKKIQSAATLILPAFENNLPEAIHERPELKIFDYKNVLLNKQFSLLKSKIRPKLNAFGQGGYGKPGLNQLKNNFEWFYITGIRFSWNFSALYTFSTEKKSIRIQQQENEIQRETFLFNNNLSIVQQENENTKTANLIATDKEIVVLKEAIKEAAKAKYLNGVITLNDYLKEINAVALAKTNMDIHIIQALLNQYNRKFSTGKY